MYVTLDFILNRFVKLWGTRRKWELLKEKFLPTTALEPNVAGASPLRHYFSSNNVRLLAYVFTVVDPQSEWLKRDEE